MVITYLTNPWPYFIGSSALGAIFAGTLFSISTLLRMPSLKLLRIYPRIYPGFDFCAAWNYCILALYPTVDGSLDIWAWQAGTTTRQATSVLFTRGRGSKVAKVATKLKAKAGKTAALHLGDEDHQAVAIWNLSVLILPDGKFWFAQGLEINYGAQGDTVEEAKMNFEDGLLATIRLHLKVYGNIERILKFAPDEILREAAQYKDSIKSFRQVSFHKILDVQSQKAIPFDGIDYRVIRQAA